MKAISNYKPLSGSAAKDRLESWLEDYGVLPLAPCWVPRDFLQPGRRLKLHPDDLYAFGMKRGGIDERWLASTVEADNADREGDEGVSYCVVAESKVELREAVDLCAAGLVGEAVWSEFRRWPTLGKLFDNNGPIPLHLHQNEEQARRVGSEPKPESYYFPPQLNAWPGACPNSFFGLHPSTSRDEFRDRLADWDRRDTRMLELSVGHSLELGTGWLVPPCILHAPGSLCTYEPQWASDVGSMYQNVVEDRFIPRRMLTSNVPEARHEDLDYLVGQIDWEANTDPDFRAKRFLRPLDCECGFDGCSDRWVVYGRIDNKRYFSAKELTVDPGSEGMVRDRGAYGIICIQGQGTINGLPLRSPTMLRFGQIGDDEYFCSADAARAGVRFVNTSQNEPMVCLRHFGPDVESPDLGGSAEGLLS